MAAACVILLCAGTGILLSQGLPAAIVPLVLVLAQQAGDADAHGEQPKPVLREQLFRELGGRLLPADITLYGPLAADAIKGEPEGLRITLPRGRPTIESGGLSMAVTVGGDFEITTSVEILEADEPVSPRRYGVGVLMSLNEKARIGRLVRFKGRQVVSWDHWATVDGKERFLTGGAPVKGNLVRLRLKREKNILHFLWAPGLEGDNFQEVYQCAFEHPEVTHIRWELSSAIDDRTSGALDARLLDLRIRSSTAPAERPPEDAPAAGSNAWLLAAAIVGLAVVVALLISLMARRRKTALVSPAESVSSADPAPPATHLAFTCSGCSKRLKARPELAGKSIKCPQCGEVVAVPNNP
jgi:hypothetical protein